MNFDKLEQAIIRYRESLARFRDDREALRALGVTNLPGDAPNSLKSSDGSPGNLPGEPTEEMVKAALDAWDTCDEPTGTKIMTRTLRAALAAAPRVEVPEVTTEDVQMAIEAWHTQDGLLDDQIECALRNFRARLIARMGAKS